jgi:UDP-N-acetylmuramoyl-L-alanyl-D-glutamate--2,6-diaminopimelate ligase
MRKFLKKLLPKKLFRAVEPYGHLLEAVLLNLVNGFPGRGMKVIGVTGTNGKTSTAYMIHKMLQEAGYNTALMTTVAWGIGDDIHDQVQHYTNVPVPELMRRLKQIRAAKADWLVMEITSQALAQHRIFGVPLSVGVMTNITHEHLDYHGTFERYVQAKLRLFKLANKNQHGLQTGIANADDPNGKRFAAHIAHPTLYGIGKGELRAKKVQLKPSGVSYQAKIGDDSYDISCNLPGSFNVYNSLAAVGVGHALGLTQEQIEQGIAALQGVEGRMTKLDEGQNFDAIVDFAHTPDSFEKLFKDLKPVVKGKLIVMFGSAGRRDETKRAIQGELAGRYADEVIITEEDDRDVDGVAIMHQIAEGAEKAGKIRSKNLFEIHDRTEAITVALQRAKKDDTVLLLGKGHEKTIERSRGAEPWDELKTAKNALKTLLQK